MIKDIDKETVMIWLSQLGKPNYLLFTALLEEFESTEGIYDAFYRGVKPSVFRGNEKLERKFADPENMKAAADIKERMKNSGMRMLDITSAAYPEKVRNLPSAQPIVLYYYGSLPWESDPSALYLSLVGSRNCSASGFNNAGRFAYCLAEHGCVIVSGLARGCDGAAHKGAISAKGKTVAVLASGADVVYPPEHRSLYNQIIDNGCVISESPPGTSPQKQLFPARNRIIAGLGDGTVVIEASKKSGALITADRALEAGRTVFALPGDVSNPLAYGCNELIRQGAVLALSPHTVLEEFGIYEDNKRAHGKLPQGWINGLPEKQSAVANAISKGYGNPDEIAELLELPASEVGSAITMLELRGVVSKYVSGEYYIAAERY